MRSLANLLEAAVRRSATEVLLESGQPVVFTTARGAESEASVLPRTELFDMIVAAVDEAHQVELAVGNPVEFTIDAGGQWSVFAEPGMDGMTVRARREGGAIGAPIALDDHDAFGPGEFRPSGFVDPLDSFPDDDDEAEFTVELESDMVVAPARRPRSPNQAPPSQLYVEALDAPAVQDSDSDFAPPSASPAAPFESGTWTLADEEDFDVGLDDGPGEDQLPTGFAEPAPAFADAPIGVPDDDDDERPFDPFGEEPPPEPAPTRRQLAPTLPATSAVDPAPSPTPAAKPKLAPSKLPPIKAASAHAPQAIRPPSRPEPASDAPTRRDMPASEPHPAAPSEPGASAPADAETRRELVSVDRSGSSLGELATSIGEGSLVFVHELGLADTLAQSFAAPSLTIDDQLGADEVWARVRGLPAGAIVIVRREDPSVLLGWILRRLEEGYRVFIETRARSPEGARRILLGVGASERAERWLDSQIVLTIEPGATGPRVRRTN